MTRSGHSHDHRDPVSEGEFRAMFEAPSWDERYDTRDAVWSGRANSQLVAVVEDLDRAGVAPGSALDVGCGEGGDAIWLAEQGWQVTGLDFSARGLERATRHAREAGVADRITWRHRDVRTDHVGTAYDLVSAQFLHLPDGGMVELTRRLAAAVAPGGTLLVVGHHPGDPGTGVRHRLRAAMFTPDELVPAIPGNGWEVRAEVRERQQSGPDRTQVTHRDSVLVATRG